MASGSNSKRQRLPSTKMKDHVQLGTEEEEEAAGELLLIYLLLFFTFNLSIGN